MMINPRGPTENLLSCFRVWGKRSYHVLVGGFRLGEGLGVVEPPERRAWTILLSLAVRYESFAPERTQSFGT